MEANKVLKHKKKKRPKRKSFHVEFSCPRYKDGTWVDYRSYASKKQQLQAIEDLNRSHAGIEWKFRAKKRHEAAEVQEV